MVIIIAQNEIEFYCKTVGSNQSDSTVSSGFSVFVISAPNGKGIGNETNNVRESAMIWSVRIVLLHGNFSLIN